MENDVIFPDSLFDFKPFEINYRKYYTTRSDSTQSLDSVVYYLSTFEIDSVQYLQLPVYLVDEYDSTEMLPNLDSIVLRHVVTTLPDSVAVIENTTFRKVPLAFNYPYFTAAIIILFIATLVIYYSFGNKIKKQVQIFFLGKRHKKFVKGFEWELQKESLKVEKLVAEWKRYLERLEGVPYSKYTSKEIIKHTGNKHLQEQLNIIDRYIYDQRVKPDTHEAFRYLLTMATEHYEDKILIIKHG